MSNPSSSGVPAARQQLNTQLAAAMDGPETFGRSLEDISDSGADADYSSLLALNEVSR